MNINAVLYHLKSSSFVTLFFRIKPEIKSEDDMEGEPPVKRVKKEKWSNKSELRCSCHLDFRNKKVPESLSFWSSFILITQNVICMYMLIWYFDKNILYKVIIRIIKIIFVELYFPIKNLLFIKIAEIVDLYSEGFSPWWSIKSVARWLCDDVAPPYHEDFHSWKVWVQTLQVFPSELPLSWYHPSVKLGWV